MTDEEIAAYLHRAQASGELRQAPSFGKPLAEDEALAATPEALRLPFKILKNAGFVPPEVEAMRLRATLAAELEACSDEAKRVHLRQRMSELEQSLALRLEALRRTGQL
jgi:hypothetical protein